MGPNAPALRIDARERSGVLQAHVERGGHAPPANFLGTGGGRWPAAAPLLACAYCSASPCWVRSRPSISCGSLTRNGTSNPITLRRM